MGSGGRADEALRPAYAPLVDEPLAFRIGTSNRAHVVVSGSTRPTWRWASPARHPAREVAIDGDSPEPWTSVRRKPDGVGNVTDGDDARGVPEEPQ